MEELNKEGRSVNFTANEIITLIEIVKKYKHIIECKKTDSTTWREKDECWSKITDELNSCCGETYRKKKSVKTKYEDMKKNLKKKLSKNKMELFKTGGGAAKIQPLTSAEEILLSFLPSTIQGLPSVFDSDRKLDEQKMSDITAAETLSQADNKDDESPNLDDTDENDWIYETLDVYEETENNSSDENNVNYINRKRASEEISNAHLKRKKTYDIDNNTKEVNALGIISNSTENCTKETKGVNVLRKRVCKEPKVQNTSKSFVKNDIVNLTNAKEGLNLQTKDVNALGIMFNSTENRTKETKGVDVLRKSVSKELKVQNTSKSLVKNDIVNLANAKEELVQLQKAALEADIQIKERNNNTQEEILKTELEISKEKLKLIKLDIQLKELEIEIKKQQFTRLL